MGLFLTLLYILTAYLSPATLFGALAPYHLELVLAVVALLFSIPSFPPGLFRQPQMLAIAGMLMAVFVSLLLTGWFRSAPNGVWNFLPDVFVYILVVTHCKTKKHLQMVVLTLFFASAYVILRGTMALYANELTSPFLFNQGIGEDVHIYRLRGLSIIGDPNDFSQVLVSLIPCLFLFWERERNFRNLVFVGLPVLWLIYGMYLTHSRGAIIALIAVIVVAAYRLIGPFVAAAIGTCTFAISIALNWSGGRQISVEAGADRMDAWATGLELIKQHPFFGVGFTRFTEYNQITAHNSIVVCAAELGFIGFFFWVLFLVTNLRNGLVLEKMQLNPQGSARGMKSAFSDSYQYVDKHKSIQKMKTLEPAIDVRGEESAERRFRSGVYTGNVPNTNKEQINEFEIRRLAGLMVLCLIGFLVAGWFLSRAYVMWLFIFGGMMQAVVQMAISRDIPFSLASLPRLMKLSLIASITLLLLVYIILRLRNL